MVALEEAHSHPEEITGKTAPRIGADDSDDAALLDAYSAAVATIDHLHKLLTADRIGQRTELTLLRHTEKRTVTIIPVESKPLIEA